jgi:diguanylate cyclase (GGDEF)-like protein
LIDISEEEAEKQELIKKSETDGMTGIYNAVTTKNLINDIIKNPVSNSKGALIIIDCDNFKDINDTQGHLIGDQVLVNISKAMIQTFRKTDTIGRIGGDEFCVYMQDISSHDFVVSKCQKLMDLISELNKGYDVTISIGISFLEGEKSYDALFKKADIALYDAKKKGRDQIQFYE